MIQPVQPVDAASVILVRHGRPVGTGWQCFMVRRPVRSEFAADVFVFPGGKVDAADRVPDAARYVREHPGPLDVEEETARLAIRLAAMRELFEEAGVLLATREAGGLLRFEGEDEGRFADYRRQLQAGELSMVELARAEGLCFAADGLHPFSRWITPEPLPRRYDTRFFVAFMPNGQEPLHDARETVDSVWISPKDALDAYRQGGFPLVFATQKQLQRMAGYPSIEQMIASVSPADLEPVMPRIVQRGEETAFLLPGDAGY